MIDTTLWRIVDANFNRAAEALRVAEDIVRLAWNDRHLSGRCKGLRHRLRDLQVPFPMAQLLHARAASDDVGRTTKTVQEFDRPDGTAVLQAAWKRCQQALRSLEEVGKVPGVAPTPHWSRDLEALRYEAYDLEKACLATRPGRADLVERRLCVLVDARSSTTECFTLVQQLVGVGVPLIQLRFKSITDRDWQQRAEPIIALTRGTATRLIINDRADLAAALDADGVHVGQDDLSVAATRRIVGPHRWIGVSTHSLAQAQQAVLAGADYLGVGPTFPSTTKDFDQWPGLPLLAQVAAEISLPAFAIGGITLQNLPQVLRSGIRHVAVQGAIVQSDDPAATAQQFLAQLSPNS